MARRTRQRVHFSLKTAVWVLILALVGGPWRGEASAQQASSDAEAKRITFENDEVGNLPSSFTAALTGKGRPVQWRITEDKSAQSGTKVLAEVSGDSTSDRFPLAIYEGVTAKNVELSVRFKPISGQVDQAAGLMARVQDPNNYYITRANALENNVRLYKVVNGRRQQFGGQDIEVPANKWQSLGFKVEGDRFEVYLDGKSLFSARDSSFSDAGKVGLWTKADSVTHFDDVTIRPLP